GLLFAVFLPWRASTWVCLINCFGGPRSRTTTSLGIDLFHPWTWAVIAFALGSAASAITWIRHRERSVTTILPWAGLAFGFSAMILLAGAFIQLNADMTLMLSPRLLRHAE